MEPDKRDEKLVNYYKIHGSVEGDFVAVIKTDANPRDFKQLLDEHRNEVEDYSIDTFIELLESEMYMVEKPEIHEVSF